MVLYRILTYLYFQAIRLFSFVSPKAKRWVRGRQDISPYIKENIAGQSVVWFHCASLGEFEQGRPLIERMKRDHPETKILLTFFSPSGYEIQKNYPHADYICYLPADRPKAINQFLVSVKPKMVVFIKYEYWFLLLDKLSQNKIPVYFVSVVLHEGHYLTRWYAASLRRLLQQVKHFYVQDEPSRAQFLKMGIRQVTVAGDTRVDRVVTLAQNVKSFPFIADWVKGKKVLICGSTWQKDEDLLIPSFEKLVANGWKIIIAPHEVSNFNINRLRKNTSNNTLVFSELNIDKQPIKGCIEHVNIMIIDTIGQLNALYQYGTAAYIGGGFTKSGIHNTLEPATFGLPIFFGPNYEKFAEAKYFVQNNGALIVEATIEPMIARLANQKALKKAGKVNKNYIIANQGATGKVVATLYENL